MDSLNGKVRSVGRLAPERVPDPVAGMNGDESHHTTPKRAVRKLQPLPAVYSVALEPEEARNGRCIYSAGHVVATVEHVETPLPGSIIPQEPQSPQLASSPVVAEASPNSRPQRGGHEHNSTNAEQQLTAAQRISRVHSLQLAANVITNCIRELDASNGVSWQDRSKLWNWSYRDDHQFWSANNPAAQPAAELLSRVEQNGYLKYGDVVILQCSQSGANSELVGSALHADGVANDHCVVQTSFSPMSAHRQCLWEVTPQLLYDAAKVLAKAENSLTRRGRKLLSADAMRRMRQKVKEEQEHNERITAHDLAGGNGDQLVQFKDTIQLRHVPSGKFLSLVPRVTSDLDPECMKVELSEGSEACIFRLQPRYRIFSEGSHIAYGAQVTLNSTKMATHSLHVSGTYGHNEVDLSIDIQGWRFIRYSSLAASSLLQAGSPVQLFHPESEAFLSASTAFYKPRRVCERGWASNCI
jgi:hypothetical protein